MRPFRSRTHRFVRKLSRGVPYAVSILRHGTTVHSNKERALYFSAPSKYTFFGARCDPRLSIGKVSYGMHVCICTYHPNVVNVTKYRQSTT